MKQVKVLLRNIWRHTIGPGFRRFQLKNKIFYYKRKYPEILNRIKRKDRINVAFFVMNLGMWKSEELFKLLLADKNFSPFVMSFLYPKDPLEYRIQTQESIQKYCLEKNYPYFNCYNFEKREWLDVESLSPDVVFYTQPYNNGYDNYKIEKLWKQCIFCYIPYCYQMERFSFFHNHLLQNIAWKMFYPTEFHLKLAQHNAYNKGENVVVCGYPLAEQLICNERENWTGWKQKDHAIKRVIWAPHHTIREEDNLNYSNFLELADAMIDIAKEYDGRIQFAFKPHPRLMNKLFNAPGWGEEKTKKYYSYWSDMPNTVYVEGDYINLFRSSDALIHDCSSFMGEYLYTQRPLMFIAKKGCEEMMNDFGRECFKQHYKGTSINDIRTFIENVVIEGKDTMLKPRQDFFKKYLLPPNGKSAVMNMYEEMLDLV